jgi:hypothetical protein
MRRLTRPRRAAAVLAAATLVAFVPGTGQTDSSDEKPLRDSGLIERADAALAQIDVTVLGAVEVLRELGPQDFKVKINTTWVREFTLDRVCPEIEEPPAPGAPESEARPLPGVPPAHYVVYFDQPYLTLMGRAQALDIAREMMPLLTRNGSRVMVVSNARELIVVEPFTAEGGSLVTAIDRLENDRTQWTMFAEQEDDRVAEVVRRLNEHGEIAGAVAMARRYQKEEVTLTDRSMRRLRLTLTQLADLRPPKALIYFGDTLRQKPGGHYLSFFGSLSQMEQIPLPGMAAGTLMGSLPFDAVINEAAAQGVRLYTVQAEGLTERMHSALPGSAAATQTKTLGAPRSIRSREARDTLRGMAAETGGESFLQGPSGEFIGERIVTDSSCMFLISFNPAGFRYDAPLRTIVSTPRDDIELRVRGRLIVQSPSAKRTASLLRAFGSPDSIEDPFELRAHLVPTGFSDGAYTALLQLAVPGTPLQSATWELGASVVRGQKIHDEASGSLTVGAPGVPVVFEHEIRFRPGEYEIVSVAHEARTGMISSNQRTVVWPDPNGKPASSCPIALLQPADAAFMRGEESRTSGSLARGSDEWIDPERPLALVAVVCRGRKDRGPLQVDRVLVGDSVVELPPLSLNVTSDRCAQVRDLIPSGTLGPGSYRYGISYAADGTLEELAHVEFSVAP